MHETSYAVTVPTSKQGPQASLHHCPLERNRGTERAPLTTADSTSTLNHPSGPFIPGVSRGRGTNCGYSCRLSH